MTTAAEIKALMAERLPELEFLREEFEKMLQVAIEQEHFLLVSRVVNRRRARTLHRRGMDVRPAGCTSTGKLLYRWAKPSPKIVITLDGKREGLL